MNLIAIAIIVLLIVCWAVIDDKEQQAKEECHKQYVSSEVARIRQELLTSKSVETDSRHVARLFESEGYKVSFGELEVDDDVEDAIYCYYSPSKIYSKQ